jgi:hypothetical protein
LSGGAFGEVARGAERLQVPGIVGSSEQHGVNVVDVGGRRAASLADEPVADENLRADAAPLPGGAVPGFAAWAI